MNDYMRDIQNNEVFFTESQRFTQWWIWTIMIGVCAFSWYLFFVQIVNKSPIGNHPASGTGVWIIFLLLGIAWPIFFIYFLKLKTFVAGDRLKIRFSPFYRRTIMLADIKTFAAEEYHPILNYGGWGIRWRVGRGMAYTTSGKWGVHLELNNGKKILIGSQRADDFASALERARQNLAKYERYK